MLSNAFRKDVELYVAWRHLVLRFRGDRLRHLYADEESSTKLVEKLIKRGRHPGAEIVTTIPRFDDTCRAGEVMRRQRICENIVVECDEECYVDVDGEEIGCWIAIALTNILLDETYGTSSGTECKQGIARQS